MLLAVDVGNTNITLGLFRGADLVGHWRLSTEKSRTADEYAVQLFALLAQAGHGAEEIKGLSLACVVPPLGPVFTEIATRHLKARCLEVGPGIKTGIPLQVDNPREVGADRIVNALAAQTRFGGPCIVADFGTATTFDVVSRTGAYLGGAIMPGLGIEAEALVQRTARLPLVEVVRPAHVIGRNTIESLQSGLLFGFVGALEEMIRRIRAELKAPRAPAIATGGLADVVARETKVFKSVEPHLTLEGLRLIWERNGGA